MAENYTPSTDKMRADYTPTVEQLRRAWHAVCSDGNDRHDYEENSAEVDRLIESVRAEERERIARNIASENVRHWREHRATAPVYRNGYDEAMTTAARIAREGA